MIGKFKKQLENFRGWRILAIIYALFLTGLNVVRCFDNNFWSDEAFSIRLCRMTIPELIKVTAGDVHPPLYYIILRFFVFVFGFSPEIIHIVSVLGFALVLVVCLTLIWDRLNPLTSIVLMSLCAFLYEGMYFNLEVRMYSWAALFMLLSFLYMRGILIENRKRDYVFFVIYSLAAAFTHYFCLLSVAFFYLGILIAGFIDKKKYLKRVIWTYVITIVSYSPWLFAFFRMLGSGEEKLVAGAEYSLISYLKYIYLSKFSFVILAIAIWVIILSLIYLKKNIASLWIVSGVASVAGTILLSIVVSKISQLALLERYFYPSIIVVWLLLAYCMTKCKYKYLYIALVLFLTVPFGIKGYLNTYQDDIRSQQALDKFLEETKELNVPGSIVLTDEEQMHFDLVNYYYDENAKTVLLYTPEEYDDYLKNNSIENFWLFMNDEPRQDIVKVCNSNGYDCLLKSECGYFGMHRIYAYYCKNIRGK